MVYFPNKINSITSNPTCALNNIPHILQVFLHVVEIFWSFHQFVRPLRQFAPIMPLSWDHLLEHEAASPGQYFHLQLAGLYPENPPAGGGSLSSQAK